MQKTKLWMFAAVLLTAWGCGKDDEPVTTGVVQGQITDATTAAGLSDVRVIVFEANTNAPVQSLTTGADGAYTVELEGGSYYLRLYRNGYDQVPPKGMSPLPFEITVGGEVAKPYEMNPSAVQNGGYIKGTVSAANAGMPGVLVVAEANGKGYSAVTDAAGEYYIYNLPAGSYTLTGWTSGYTSESQTVAVTAETESLQHLQLTQGAVGTVSGAITFLATTALETDIALVHPLTMEAIPGLNTKATANYSISNVPAGTYIARATYQNDERVVDPDWIIKFGEPVVMVDGAEELDFSLTGAVKPVAPTNLATTTEPVDVSATPTFSWQPYSSASDYVLELSDANGNVVWGGFSEGMLADGTTGPVKNMSTTSTTATYDGATPLVPGKVYRWRVYASKNDNKEATGWKLISVSEDQMGLIRIAN